MNKIDRLIDSKIIYIITAFLFIGPVIDVATYVSSVILNWSISFGAIIKFLFMLLFVYYLVFISKNKHRKKIIIYELILLIYLLLFSMNILSLKTFDAFFYEAQNSFRTWFFPILFPILISIFDDKKKEIDIKHFVYVFLIYLVFIIIPYLTNTSYTSYAQGKTGNGGWFISTNEVSAILAILFPIVFYYLTKSKKVILNILIIIATLFVFFIVGTKLLIISLFITIFIFLISKTINLIKNKKYYLISILFVCLVSFVIGFIYLVPKTTFYKNIKTHLDFLEIDSVQELVTSKELINRFVFSDRLTFFEESKDNYIDSNIPSKLVGIGYIENYGTDEVNTKMVEMDIFDIFLRHGVLGFIIYFYILVIYLFKEILKNRKHINLAYKIAIFMIVFTTILTGHVLIAPSVSYLVIMILIACKKETN